MHIAVLLHYAIVADSSTDPVTVRMHQEWLSS